MGNVPYFLTIKKTTEQIGLQILLKKVNYKYLTKKDFK